jgi:hypothetical protein
MGGVGGTKVCWTWFGTGFGTIFGIAGGIVLGISSAAGIKIGAGPQPQSTKPPVPTGSPSGEYGICM